MSTVVLFFQEKEKWVLETQLLKMRLDQCQREQNSTSVQSTNPVLADDRRSDDSAYVEEYYGNRVAELSSQLQDANSRIVFFQSEVCIFASLFYYQYKSFAF